MSKKTDAAETEKTAETAPKVTKGDVVLVALPLTADPTQVREVCGIVVNAFGIRNNVKLFLDDANDGDLDVKRDHRTGDAYVLSCPFDADGLGLAGAAPAVDGVVTKRQPTWRPKG